MAAFTRFNRKAALLLPKLAGKGYTQGNQKIPPFGGITVNTVRYWRRSEGEYKDALTVSDGMKTLFGIDDPRNLLASDVSVKEFTAFLGYTVSQGREIIDHAYSELYPTYSIFYAQERAARDVVDRFTGLHLVYRIESGERAKQFTNQAGNIIQMPLTVRYMLKGTKPGLTELFRVRCKLNIPSYTAVTACFEYDGYLTPQKYDTHYWLFENRSEENKDLLFMITNSLQIIRRHHEGTLKEESFTQGIMLTRRQDAWPVHKLWKVVMVKLDEQDCRCISPIDTIDAEAHFMTSQCKVVPTNEVPHWIVAALHEGWKGLEVFS